MRHPRPARPLAGVAIALALAGLLPSLAAAQQPGPPRPSQSPQAQRDRVHDPVIIREGDYYYLFVTGNGIPMRRSRDLTSWEELPPVFGDLPDSLPRWAKDTIPGVRNIWAPDISFFNGKYHLYYSLSTFGKNSSAMGLATNVTLDPRRPDYRWEDRGMVVKSVPENQWNAIDPNVVLDAEGQPWLSWGSFWGGIKMRKLDAATGMPSQANDTLYSLAARPVERSIEAPFIIRRGDYYYLFVSYDACCRGVNSTYRIVVGRSKSVTGPYEDRYRIPMMLGGATPVLSGAGRVRGPGHNAVITEGDRHLLVHHFYDMADNGRSKLQVRPLTWDADGWPYPGEPLSLPPVPPAGTR